MTPGQKSALSTIALAVGRWFITFPRIRRVLRKARLVRD